MATAPVRAVNLELQQLTLRTTLTGAVSRVRRGRLTCTFRLQPSAASGTYTLRLEYRHRRRPRVWVIDPQLTLHPGATRVPHVFGEGDLCLWYPGEWTDDMLLAHTVVPWAADWLFHYEIWLATGTWTGGGHAEATSAIHQQTSGMAANPSLPPTTPQPRDAERWI